MQESQEQPIVVGLADAWSIIRLQQTTIGAVTGAMVVLAFVGTFLVTPQYESTAVLHLKPEQSQELKNERVQAQAPSGARAKEVFTATQLQIMESRTLLEEVIRRFDSLDLEGKEGAAGNVRSLRQRVRPRLREDTQLVDLSVTHPDPDVAAVLANLIAEVYRGSTLKAAREAATDARTWLETQLQAYEQNIDTLSNEIVTYQSDNDLADAELDITARSAEMEALNLAYGKVNTELVTLESEIRVHTDLMEKGQYRELSKAMNTPLVNALTDDYATAVTAHAKVAARYGVKHPQRQYAEAELARIEKELRREVRRTIASEKATLTVLQSNKESYEAEIAAAKEQLLSKQRLLDGYQRLRRELDRSTAQYANLNQAKDELDLQARTQLSNVRIIDPAVPSDSPASPKLLLNLILSVVMGLGMGVTLGFVREYLDDSISSRADVETYLRVPYIGAIPFIPDTPGENRALYTATHPQSHEAETVRSIRTILETQPSGPMQVMLITSALMAEGKTETAVRLAVAFAKLGRRVLVIDADLRRPRVHRVFELDRGPGLADLLMGAEAHPTYRNTEVEGVDVLTIGNSAMRATERLGSTEMEKVLEMAAGDYDLVIIDSPPAGIAADAAMLSRLADGVVFVLREAVGSRRVVAQTLRDLESAGAHIVGAILNAVEYKHGSPYAYRYSYTYTEDEPSSPKGNAAK